MSLEACLRRTAFFAETHAIKGWLSARRLAARFAALRGGPLEDLEQWNYLLAAPEVDGLLGARVRWHRASIADRRLRFMVRGAVFPMAYVAAVELAHRQGLAALFQADADLALRASGTWVTPSPSTGASSRFFRT